MIRLALVAVAVAALVGACGVAPSQGAGQSSPPPSPPEPTPSLTVIAPFGVLSHVKSAGTVLSVRGADRVVVRVDAVNMGAQAVIDNAVLLLRSEPGATVFIWATVGQARPGASATSMADLKAGEHVTFAYDQRTRNAADGSYLASVIGRSLALASGAPLISASPVRPAMLPELAWEQRVIAALASAGFRVDDIGVSKFEDLFGERRPARVYYSGNTIPGAWRVDIVSLDDAASIRVCPSPGARNEYTIRYRERSSAIGSTQEVFFAAGDGLLVMASEDLARDALRSALALSVPTC